MNVNFENLPTVHCVLIFHYSQIKLYMRSTVQDKDNDKQFENISIRLKLVC